MYRKRGIVKWVILLGVAFTTLGLSYAAHTNVLTSNFTISTSNMSFIFDSKNDQEVNVKIQNGSCDTVNLGGTVSFEDKILTINDIGPIDMEDLEDGDAIITIDYAIKVETEEQGIRRPASIESKKDNGYDLGEVKFELMSHTPIWKLENGDQSWGTGELMNTPEIVYGLLPNDLGTFHASNILIPDEEEDGVMNGTIRLEQITRPDLSDELAIGLSSLNLPEEIISEIKSGSSESILQIKGNYGFEIPLNLDQFNVER